MASFRINLLGSPALEGAAGPLRLSGKKASALLWYLAAQSDRAFSRAHLAALLWDQGGEEESRGSLRQTLSRLRKALPVWPLHAAGDTLQWDKAAPVQVDVIQFRHLIEKDDRESLAAAAALWRGPFLDGFHVPDSEAYDEWLHREQPAWGHLMLETLTRLIQADETAGEWETLTAHARCALEIDPLQEHFHRALMKAHQALGDRAAALVCYDACRRLLDAELGVPPDPATTALYEDIAAGRPLRNVPNGTVSPAAPSAPLPPPQPPLVGRGDELARVENALARAAAGNGRAVLLHGEAGIGKTRLVEEVLWRQRRPGAAPSFRTVLTGRCQEASRDIPYAPVVEALNTLLPSLDLNAWDLPDVWLAEVGRLVPDLAVRRPDLPPPPALDPGRERRRLFEGLTRFLAALPGPVLFVLEDLHWADEATLQFLAYLAHQPLAQGVALLVTARSGDLPEATGHLLRQLERDGHLVWLELGLLTEEAIHTLAASFTGRRDADLGDRLYAGTKGHPLFAVAFLRSLRESGRLDGPEPVMPDELPVPPTVLAVIQGRLARLSPPTRDFLATVSIFEEGVPLHLPQRVAGLERGEALAALEDLVRLCILREEEGGGDPQLTFSHDLVRRAVREDMTRTERQDMHRRAFQGLVEAAATADGRRGLSWLQAERLARHAIAGGLWNKALEWNLRGAAMTRQVSLPSAAARFLEQALDCLGRLPSTPERRRQAIDIRLQLATAFFYVRPERIPEWLGPAAAEAAELDDAVRLAQVRVLQTNVLFFQGRLPEALSLLEQVLPTARSSGSEALLAACLRVRGLTLAMSGDFGRAIAALEEAVPLDERVGNPLQAVIGRGTLALCHAAKGDFSRSEALFRDMVQESRDRGDPTASAYSLAFLAVQAGVRGDWEAAAAAGREATRLARETGFLYQEYLAGLYHGPALALRGDLPGALAAQEQAIDLARRTPTQVWLGHAHAWLGDIRLAAGEAAAALDAARAGLEIAEAQGARYDAALCAKVLGKAAAAAGRPDEARRHMAEALERFTAIGARPEMARCHAALAAVAERESASLQHRRTAEEMFQAMGMAWDLQALAGLLA